MKRSAWFLAGTLVAWSGAAHLNAQSSGVQANASAEHKTAASASQSGAQANSSTSASASAQAGQNSANLSSGTELQAVLTKPVDAKKNKPGDNVTAKATQALKSDGQVIPKGSQIVGHVTEARARVKGESESALGIVFDRAILKNGQEVPLNASIQALAVAQSVASASPGDADLSGSAMGSGGAGARSGGGVLGGAGSAVGGAASTVTNTSANVGGAAAGTLDSAAATAGSTTGRVSGAASGAVSATSQGAVGGLNSAGQFTSHTQGVFGLQGLNLNTAASNSTTGTLITSPSKNVHLDSGTRMLLVAHGSAQAGHQDQQ